MPCLQELPQSHISKPYRDCSGVCIRWRQGQHRDMLACNRLSAAAAHCCTARATLRRWIHLTAAFPSFWQVPSQLLAGNVPSPHLYGVLSDVAIRDGIHALRPITLPRCWKLPPWQNCSRRAACTHGAQETKTCLRLMRPPVDEQRDALLPAAAAQHAVTQAAVKHGKLPAPGVDQEAALRGVRLGTAQPVVILLIHNDGWACQTTTYSVC